MTKRAVKNAILQTITAIAAAAFVIGAMLLDSESLIPTAMVAGGLIWMGLFFYAQERR